MSVDPWDERRAVMHGPTPTPQPSGSLGQSRLLGHEVGPGSAATQSTLLHIQSQEGNLTGQQEDGLWISLLLLICRKLSGENFWLSIPRSWAVGEKEVKPCEELRPRGLARGKSQSS